jgi:hypothetical protein
VGSTLTLQLAATDPDGDELTFSAQPLPLPVGASLDGELGLFTFRPGLEHVGTLELSFQVSDGTATDSETVPITVTGPAPTDPTTLTGQVLDTNDYVAGITTPVVAATVSILGSGVSTTTDLAGDFVLAGVPAGKQVFDIDPSTAWTAPDGSTYAGFREALVLIEHADNVIERPFFLPRIDPAGEAVVDPTQTTIVTNPNLGITMVVPPHTAKNPDGSDFFRHPLDLRGARRPRARGAAVSLPTRPAHHDPAGRRHIRHAGADHLRQRRSARGAEPGRHLLAFPVHRPVLRGRHRRGERRRPAHRDDQRRDPRRRLALQSPSVSARRLRRRRRLLPG